VGDQGGSAIVSYSVAIRGGKLAQREGGDDSRHNPEEGRG